MRIQQVSAWAHVPDTPGLQLKCPAADMAAGCREIHDRPGFGGRGAGGRDSRGLLHLSGDEETVEIKT